MQSPEKPAKAKLTTGQVLAEEVFGFNAWLLQAVDKFPRNHKFLLGDRLQAAGIDLMLAIVEATYTKERSGLLRGAQISIEKLRFLFRLANQAGIVSHGAYEHAARQLDQIGRGVGGWRKAHHAEAARQSVSADRQFRGSASGSATSDPG